MFFFCPAVFQFPQDADDSFTGVKLLYNVHGSLCFLLAADLYISVLFLSGTQLVHFLDFFFSSSSSSEACCSFVHQPVFIFSRIQQLSTPTFHSLQHAVGLFAGAFYLGIPQEIDDNVSVNNAKVQITKVAINSPASEANLKAGDQIVSLSSSQGMTKIEKVKQVQEFTQKNIGQKIVVSLIPLGKDKIEKRTLTLRKTAPEGEGILGVAIIRSSLVRESFFQSIKDGAKEAVNVVMMILIFLKNLIVKIFSVQPISEEVAGPIGIAIMTKQVAQLGLAFILRFAALLSINLAVVNLLPLPALDGGRILFLLIEKIKGSPVSQKVEGWVHTGGFIFLMGLMILVTWRDFVNFDLVEKIKNLF